MRILCAVPTFESIKPETFKSIYDLDKGSNELDFEFVKGYDCAVARNKIAKLAMDRMYEYVLMVDSDMVIPHDALTELLKSDAQIVLSFYQRRNGAKGDAPIFKKPYRPYNKRDLAELPEFVDVVYGGFGCALVKVNVFREMQFPYFEYIWNAETNLVSEDISFCKRAKFAGMRIQAATKVWCGHIIAREEYGE